ncbi:hypothetical protein FGO68_gene10452 [Halteria grandinella]|uniref:Oxysterol-binding protein n=1 Tax=Halteria grandinella TaxID=5974 RepID=A0A8J8NP65_HALGN|nr:hypothetical protein FGO68_gene10452 [Halteria grandinella]
MDSSDLAAIPTEANHLETPAAQESDDEEFQECIEVEQVLQQEPRAGVVAQDDLPERSQLPYLKGQNKVKVSLWSVLKDSVGKDIWKITVPVVFNEPLGILQKAAGVTEYIDILDQAIAEPDEMRRFALATLHFMTQYQNIERGGLAKPFNPLLGETFEYCVPGRFLFLAEQVSHHPPVSAFYIQGYSGYLKQSTFHTKTSFGMGSINFTNIFNEYLDLLPYRETFEWFPPSLGLHGLMMGRPYIDVDGSGWLRDQAKPMEKYAHVRYHSRGWTQGTYFKVEAEVYQGKEIVYKLEGKWSESITLKDMRGNDESPPEVVWRKRPYPENWQHQYGMTHHNIQLNYLPKFLAPFLPPTDTRFRPDQRALENGDFALATKEKARLEEKQRATRKQKEKDGIKHVPKYFVESVFQSCDPNFKDNGIPQYRYNREYFEKDRVTCDWSRLEDIFAETPKEEEKEVKQ